MKKMIAGLGIGVLIGLILSLLVSSQLEKFLSPGSIVVEGNLAYSPAGSPVVSGTEPEGYYIVNQTRFYIEPVQPGLVGKVVRAVGTLRTICGPDGIACFPLIKANFSKEVSAK